jgi:hypothetical protein
VYSCSLSRGIIVVSFSLIKHSCFVDSLVDHGFGDAPGDFGGFAQDYL